MNVYSKIVIFIVIICALVLCNIFVFEKYIYLLIICLGVMLFILLAHISVLFVHMYYYIDRLQNIETVRLNLNHFENNETKHFMHFIHFVHNVLQPIFSFYSYFQGVNYMVLELKLEKGQKNIYLSATDSRLPFILRNLQTIYPHLRYEKVASLQQIHPEIIQLRWQRNFIFPFFRNQSTENTSLNGSFADSLFTVLDGSNGDAGCQMIISPHVSVKKRRGVFFKCKMGIYADHQHTRQALIAIANGSSIENTMISEAAYQKKIRKFLTQRHLQWFSFVNNSLLGGPNMLFTAEQLIPFLKVPKAILQVSGLVRTIHQRLPVPAKIPLESEVELPLLQTEAGAKVGLTESMLEQHLLILGVIPSGKLIALATQAIPYFNWRQEPSVMIVSSREELEYFLSCISPNRKVYILDMDKPSEWGVNFLANDEIPADMINESLMHIFTDIYGTKMNNVEIIGQAYLALRKVRERKEWKSAIPTIDLRHIKEMLSNKEYRLHVTLALPAKSALQKYWVEQTKFFRNVRYYTTLIAPIVHVLDSILANDHARKMICHPYSLNLKKILYEEQAIILFHGGKWDFGFNLNSFVSSMFLAHWYHFLLDSSLKSSYGKVNLFIDEIAAISDHIIARICIRAGKMGIRIVATSSTYLDISANVRPFLEHVIGNKLILRTYTNKDAQYWSSLLDALTVDDFNNMPFRHVVASLTIEGMRKEPFIAKIIEYPQYMNYLHNRPRSEKLPISLFPIRNPHE